MKSMREEVNAADKLRNALTALEPDARARTTGAVRADGTTFLFTLEEQHRAVSGFELNLEVPIDIRVHFETAKNLYLYAWFVYRFYPVAERQALSTLEFALRERLTLLFPADFGSTSKRKQGLSALLRKASVEKLIANNGLRACHRWAMQRARQRVADVALQQLVQSGAAFVEFDYDSARAEPTDYSDDALSVFIETLPKIRNAHAHGSAMLHSMVLGTFEIVTDLVNQLYLAESSAK